MSPGTHLRNNFHAGSLIERQGSDLLDRRVDGMTAPWQAVRTNRPDWPADSADVRGAVDAARAALAAAALDGLVGTWRRAPRQVLARLHTLAAADLVAVDDLGRPRADPDRPDLVSGRLAVLADLVV